jgi:hypothetical protein
MYLYKNRNILLHNGIFTPNEINHISFFKKFSNKFTKSKSELLKNNLIFDHEVSSNNFSDFVISCEFFSAFNSDEWGLLKEFTQINALNIKIILYVRDLIEITVSSKQELLKKGIGFSVSDPSSTYIPLSYRNIIGRLLQIFDKANIDIRKYGSSSSADNVVKDFIVNVLGQSFYNNINDVNKSLSLRAALILNHINCIDSDIVKKTDLLEVLQLDNGPKFGPSEDEFRYYSEKFKIEYLWIKDNYGFCFDQDRINIYSNSEPYKIIEDDYSKKIIDFYINAKSLFFS